MTVTVGAEPAVRHRLRVTGVVQGVGFRPHVHRLATDLGLAGFVGNDSEGVFAELEGPPEAVQRFEARLVAEAPPLAAVEGVEVRPLDLRADHGFRIVASRPAPGQATLLPPDVAVCDQCLAELFDPADRRYRYPFINCTNCGPRFTITRRLPYDRPNTTMTAFTLCPACAGQYHDPADRRFHAQPLACAACGPRLWFEGSDGTTVEGTDAAPAAAQAALAAGRIVAVKGIGGYHLACDATDPTAVAPLRERKRRPHKPLAVMVPDLAAAGELADLDEVASVLLRSPERPIVLVPRRDRSPLAPSVAPGSPQLGLFLPYSPLHHLLFTSVPTTGSPVPSRLVMTSGNLADEPICFDDAEAHARLGGIAEAWLVHDRPIHMPCDDSVVRVEGGRELPIRRARGFAPLPIRLSFTSPPLLATGGEIKNTFCLASGRYAWVSQHLGDMGSLETLAAYERSVRLFTECYEVSPGTLAADTHPGYQARRWAEGHATGPVELVQHHHAHVASVMAEHAVAPGREVIGFVFDGTGYGPDGAIWGGEVLVASYRTFRRAAHLRYVPLPGGDAAVRHPARVALAHLWAAGIPWDRDCRQSAPSRPRRGRCGRPTGADRAVRPNVVDGPAVRRGQLPRRPAPHRLVRGPGGHGARGGGGVPPRVVPDLRLRHLPRFGRRRPGAGRHRRGRAGRETGVRGGPRVPPGRGEHGGDGRRGVGRSQWHRTGGPQRWCLPERPPGRSGPGTAGLGRFRRAHPPLGPAQRRGSGPGPGSGGRSAGGGTVTTVVTTASESTAGVVAEGLAVASLALARRFHAGATLWCLAPRWPSHARHLAVEFVHPVIVGKRALPASSVEGADPVGWLRLMSRPGDVLIGVGPADDPVTDDLVRRSEAWGVASVRVGAGPRPPGFPGHPHRMAGRRRSGGGGSGRQPGGPLPPAVGADPCRPRTPGSPRTGSGVFGRALCDLQRRGDGGRGPVGPRAAGRGGAGRSPRGGRRDPGRPGGRRRAGAGPRRGGPHRARGWEVSAEATGFLYPFIEADEQDAPRLVDTMARSAGAKLAESRSLRRAVVEQYRDELDRAGSGMAHRLTAGGRLLAMGNGGSATDAEGLVALCSDPSSGVPLAALSLTGEVAVVTALANDVGFESVFSRQVIALAVPEDCLVGFSTSGDSPNLLRAFDQASARGLMTIGFSGNHGGAMAAFAALDHCFVVPSDSVHRIQEAQGALTLALWGAVQRHLGPAAPQERSPDHDRRHQHRTGIQPRVGGVRAHRGLPATEAPAGGSHRDPGPRGRGQGGGRPVRDGVPARLRQRGAARPGGRSRPGPARR